MLIFSSLLTEIRWSVCMSKSHRSLCVSFSRTDADLCMYHLLIWSNLNFLHISQWIALPIQSCLVSYFFPWRLLKHYFSFFFFFLRGNKIGYFWTFYIFFFLLLIIIRFGLLAEIPWSVSMSKSHWSLCMSFSRTGAGLCIYHLFIWSNWSFLHISQWTAFYQICMFLTFYL